jgi:hypothetical protein
MDDPLTRASEALGAVYIVAGPNELTLEVAGHTTGEVWEPLSQVLAIDELKQALVNDRAVGSDYRLEPGDRLEFQA